MRVMVMTIAALTLIAPGRGFAQETLAPFTLPPVLPGESSPLGDGKVVSRPLTPVAITPESPPNEELQPSSGVRRVEDVQDQKYSRRGPLGPGWDDLEFLMWWPKAQALPPLVTASRSGQPPILGNPGTAMLIGSNSVNNQDIGGGRFTLGASINSEQTLGIEGVYFFLGSRTIKESVQSNGNPSALSLGLPFVNSATGQEDVFIVAEPGVSRGSVFVATTTRVQGAEANFVANLYDGINIKLNGIVGYRFLEVNEGIAIADMRTELGTTGSYGPIYDGFDGHNQFNGGQLGLHMDMVRGIVFCELTGKVAIGVTTEVVKVQGASTLYTPILGGVSSQNLAGGVYALPTNIGRYTHDAFAVVPEGIMKFGLKLGDESRVFVGYNFLYLSDLVRPGDQIDRTINPSQIPVLGAGGTFSGADRPRVPFGRSDFWTQGLIIGLETRY